MRNKVILDMGVWFIWAILSASAMGYELAGGTGEPNDPYQIATAEQLISIGSDTKLLNKHFILVADIDLDPNLPGGKAFTQAVIAPGNLPFTGSFNGREHVIQNLVITNPDRDIQLGLFGSVGRAGRVENLGIEKVTVKVTSVSYLGGLVGKNDGGLISSCHSSVDMTATAYVGGLVGWNSGAISASYSTGRVTGGTVGGLVGRNYSAILEDCHSTGRVNGSGSIGGLVGYNDYSPISRCYATGEISGSGQYVGGLVGWSMGSVISTSYATGSVTGKNNVGGLVGSNQYGMISGSCTSGTVTGSGDSIGGLIGYNITGMVKDCYSIGATQGNHNVGGLVGWNQGSMLSFCYAASSVAGTEGYSGGLVGAGTGRVTGCYFLAQADGGGPDNRIGWVLSDPQMKARESFRGSGWDFWDTAADGISDLWFMPADAYPVFVWQTEVTGMQAVPSVAGLSLDQAQRMLQEAGFVPGEIGHEFDRILSIGLALHTYPYDYALPGSSVNLTLSLGAYDWSSNPGDGSEANPYLIGTVATLESLADHPELWDRAFVLTADIDLARRTYSTALIAPDENDAQSGFQGVAFTGRLNGNGFRIMNLSITSQTADYLGLFGQIGQGGQVSNLGLENAMINGGHSSDSVSTIAGRNNGTMTYCFATGSVSGYSGVYGLSGQTSDSYADVLVRGYDMRR